MNLTHIMPKERSPNRKNTFCIVSFIPSSKTFLISGLEMRIEMRTVVTFGEGREGTPEWFLDVGHVLFLELVCNIHFVIIH